MGSTFCLSFRVVGSPCTARFRSWIVARIALWIWLNLAIAGGREQTTLVFLLTSIVLKAQGDQKKSVGMASLVRGVFKAIKEKGIVNFAKDLKAEGYLNCIFDGNLLQTKIHNIGATLVGVDKFGNKYYQRLDVQYGRHRWVEYAQKSRYNASQVPPEWHGWLHFITDHTGDELLMLKPKRYGVEHKENFSGEGDEYIYHSKGHALNPGQRDWTRYQPWLPSKTST